MSKPLLAVAALVGLTGTAAAESYQPVPPTPAPSRGYIGAGVVGGFQRTMVAAMYVDGGARIVGTPLFVHGQLTGGQSGDDRGSLVQMRAGIEARGCVLRLACAFAGFDTGYQRDRIFGAEEYLIDHVDAHDVLLVPRVGLEVGRKIRVRAVAEAPMYRQLNEPRDQMEGTESGTGMTLSVAVAGVF